MRLVLVLSLAALPACPRAAAPECTNDSDCGGDVCARDGECLPASQVHSVRVTWTIRGQPASTASCAGSEELFIHFAGPAMGDSIGYAPVPCMLGQFSIDKLPRSYDSVEVGVERGPSSIATITGSEVVVDLPL